MPRNPGTGVYTKPSPDVITGTTIESTVYNTFVGDVETDLNLPRPIVAGGTGANNATTARANLHAEVAGVQVTNYDSHVFENGSFWSYAGATGAPNSVNGFNGIAVLTNNDPAYVVLIAQNIGTVETFVRVKFAGVWGAWFLRGSDKVAKAGDTMTGDLIISKANPTIALNADTGTIPNMVFQKVTGNRWNILGGADAETGANTGSNFYIQRFNDAGTLLDNPMIIRRDLGRVQFPNPIVPQQGMMDNANASLLRFLVSGGLFQYDINQSAAWRTIFDTSNNTFTSGYMKLANGWLLNYGTQAGSDAFLAFPNAFPTQCLGMVITANTGVAALVGGEALTVSTDNVSSSNFAYRLRLIQNGGTVGATSQTIKWIAWGY